MQFEPHLASARCGSNLGLVQPAMKASILKILILSLFIYGLTAEAQQTPPKRNWDDLFEGVVHDDKRIAGFVGEYRWLSNFYSCRVEFEGLVYLASEGAYHASKYPKEERGAFTKLDPDSAKKLSRQKGVDQVWWDARKDQVMRDVVWAKFSQNKDLAEKLIATGDRQLEETNWWCDKYWGVFKGDGEDVLGKILMETRARLRVKPRAEP